jgi:hypothetical protein
MNPARAPVSLVTNRLINSAFAIILAMLVGELIEINRFVRLWLHGHHMFLGYEAIFAILMLTLGFGIAKHADSADWRPLRWGVWGSALGFVASFVAVLCTSVPGRGQPSVSRLIIDGALFSLVTLSWGIGALWAVSINWVSTRNYRSLLLVFLFAIAVRAIETVGHLIFRERLF